jgi:hypothetical protein
MCCYDIRKSTHTDSKKKENIKKSYSIKATKKKHKKNNTNKTHQVY